MSFYGIECQRCGGTIFPGDGHDARHYADDVAELVKAAQDAERTHARYELETLTDCAAVAMSDAIVRLRAALKRFKRQP